MTSAMALAGVFLLVLSCGDGAVEPTPPPPTSVATAVTVSPAAATLTALEETARLTVEVRDQSGQVMAGAAVAWTTSDASVAAVDASGLVTAMANGNATITATAGDASGVSEITVENPDRAALAALYHATDGPNWVNNENWLTDAPLGEWYGVETDAAGRVVGLALAGEWDTEVDQPIRHGLAGPIPPELGKLAALERLDLGLNEVSGPIPPELGDLSALEELLLGDNQLSGSIPPELGNLANLDWLSLFSNRLGGPIPPELGNLTALEILNLSSNELSGPIPSELASLTSLRQLDLGFNRLTDSIPSELGSLVRLYRLSLQANQLTGPIPPQLAGIRGLELLFLRWNQLSGPVPPGIVRMERLRWLALRGNASLCRPGTSIFTTWLAGIERQDAEDLSLCNELDNTVLRSLYQSTGGSGWTRSDGWVAGGSPGQWYGVVTDSLGRVTTLDLARNGLSGRLPSNLGLLDRLTELRIGDNDLSGRLPSSLARLPLQELHYVDTGLCAPTEERFQEWLKSIPSHEGTGIVCPPLSDREILVALYEATGGPNWRLPLNWLTEAPLKEWVGVGVDHLGRVVELNLAFQGMVGTIPSELGSLSSLTTLDLCCNELSGPIPPELGSLGSMKRLLLSQNELSGPIPPELGRLGNLNELLLNHNGLAGPIPPELGGLTGLAELGLQLNELSGPIPSELGSLSNLTTLDLCCNKLSGPIPPELGNLVSLKRLSLLQNELSGPVPSELGSLANLTTLDLCCNELGGPIPPEPVT